MSRFSKDLPKRIFVGCAALSVLTGVFLYGVLAQRSDLPPVPQFRTAYQTLPNLFAVASDDGQASHLQPARGQGDGVVVNARPDDGALIFMAGFFDGENQVRLVERDGSVARKWSLDYFAHFPDPATRPCDLDTPLRVDTHGSLLTRQGELVFNYEYCGTVKLDQCGELVFAVDRRSHHSLIESERGGYLALGREEWRAGDYPDRLPPFSTPGGDRIIKEDTILRIGETGEVLEEYSIPELMIASGLEALLTANGEKFTTQSVVRAEIVHANKVAELPRALAAAYPLFAPGDLAISMRKLNLLIVVDPQTRKVKWHQIGPWLRQHDPEFRPDGRISIFNNNVYRTAYGRSDQTDLDAPRRTNILAVDPVTRQTERVFGEAPGQEMLSVIRGQHELLPDGGMIITEFDAGRVLQVDAEGQVLWDYVNRFDDAFVGEITNAQLYPADYFETGWKSCGG